MLIGRVFANSLGDWSSIPVWRYPFGPHVTSTSSNHFHIFTVGDQLVVPIGVSHISLRYKNTIEGAGGKRTNEQYAWVNSSAEEELCNIVHV